MVAIKGQNALHRRTPGLFTIWLTLFPHTRKCRQAMGKSQNPFPYRNHSLYPCSHSRSWNPAPSRSHSHSWNPALFHRNPHRCPCIRKFSSQTASSRPNFPDCRSNIVKAIRQSNYSSCFQLLYDMLYLMPLNGKRDYKIFLRI